MKWERVGRDAYIAPPFCAKGTAERSGDRSLRVFYGRGKPLPYAVILSKAKNLYQILRLDLRAREAMTAFFYLLTTIN